MNEGFEGWVRVLGCGPFAYAAMTAAAIPNVVLAVICGAAAATFAIFPERLAFAYRKNRPLPLWSKTVSVVNPDASSDGQPVETFQAYHPTLTNLFSAYFSISMYVVLAFHPWRVPLLHVPFLMIAGAAVLLGLLARSER